MNNFFIGKKRPILLAGLAALLLIASGCEGNLFMDLDKPDLPSVSEISGRNVSSPSGANDFLSDVQDWMDADLLSGDGLTSEAVADKLAEIYGNGSLSPDIRQKAAAMAGKVAIEGNEEASEVVENLITSLDGLTDEGSTTDPEDFFSSLIPSSAKNNSSVFNNMVNTLATAAKAYLALGNIGDSNGDGVADPGEELSELSSGDLGNAVQRAAVGVAVLSAVDALDGSLDGPGSVTLSPADTETLQDIVNGTGSFSVDPLTVYDGGNGYNDMAFLLDYSGLSFN